MTTQNKSLDGAICEIEHFRQRLLPESYWGLIEGVWAGNPAPENDTWGWIEPDETPAQEKENIRAFFRQIYDGNNKSSKWYSARYAAGKYLMMAQQDELEKRMNEWCTELEKQLISISEGAQTPEKGVVPDSATRVSAVQDLGKLLEISNSPDVSSLIKKAYHSNTDKATREEAGKILRYSKPRIWLHEHKTTAILTAIAAAGIAYGLGYMLYEQFSK